MTGICAMQGPPGEPEIVYGSVVDYYAAALLAGGVSSALYQRERTGQGQTVNISLMRSALAMQSARLVWAQGEGRDVYRDMRSGGITGLHPTKQGSLYISANTPHFWQALCELIDEPQLASDERYDSVRKRAEHAQELVPRIRAALARRTALEWEERFGERVPCSAVREVEDMFDHPQVLAEEMVQEFEHPLVGRYRGVSRAMTFGGGEPAPATAAPVFAQHADEVLARLGYEKQEIEQLRREGVIP
jgi:crotonobetainyl-CoA:carnitine CoA-transferase CaiB-like acyl-CoA transferase